MTKTLSAFDPFALFAEWRAEGPVVRRDRSWLALSYESCSRVLGDHSVFSSSPVNSEDGPTPQLSMLSTDLPEHARLRSATSHAFRQRRVMAVHPVLNETARTLVAALGDGPELELMAGLADPLAQAAIAEMVGVSEEDRPSFWRSCAGVMAVAGRGTRPRATAEDESDVARLKVYLRNALQRRTDPKLLIGALGAEHDEGKLTEDEAVSSAMAVLVGGIGTTAGLIGNALVALVEHNEAYRDVAADRRLLPQAVIETLRHSPPVLAVPRWARHDTVLEGRAIGARSVVLAVTGSANRDPNVFPEAQRFNIRRDGAPPLSFGYGPHHCPGRGLALDVAHIALDAVLSRFPALTPACSSWAERPSSMFVYGPARVQVRVGEGRTPP
jgi:cytochrome P450